MSKKHITPVINCENPQYAVLNGRVMAVPCGKCRACQLQASNSLSGRVRKELELHPYNLFFTLTYNNENVPYLELSADSPQLASFKVNCTKHNRIGFENHYLSRNYDFLASGVVPLNNVDRYHNGKDVLLKGVQDLRNFDCPAGERRVGVLWPLDITLFLKRFRTTLTRYVLKSYKHETEERKQELREFCRVKYFIVGEYGPTTLRPHYHGIIFCDSREVSAHIVPALCESWPYGDRGRIENNCSFIQGSAGNYVSSYIACTSSLPLLYKACSVFSPFHVYSRGLGLSESEKTALFESIKLGTFEKVENVYSDELQNFAPLVLRLSPSDCRQFFRKCYGYSDLTDSARAIIYKGNSELESKWKGDAGINIDYSQFSPTAVYKFLRTYISDYLNELLPNYAPFFEVLREITRTTSFKVHVPDRKRNYLVLPRYGISEFVDIFLTKCKEFGCYIYIGHEWYNTFEWYYFHPSSVYARHTAQKVVAKYGIDWFYYFDLQNRVDRYCDLFPLAGWYELQDEYARTFNSDYYGQEPIMWTFLDDTNEWYRKDNPASNSWKTYLSDEIVKRVKTRKVNDSLRQCFT